MKTVIEMARDQGLPETEVAGVFIVNQDDLGRFAERVCADERNSWPAEMEAMERQVNILTDALAQEREACAKVCEQRDDEGECPDQWDWHSSDYATAIRARSNT